MNDIVDVDLFATVKVLTALVAPMATLPNERDAGLIVAGAAPVPVRLLVWVPAESATVSVPVREPTAVGVKVTEMEQLPLAATEPQLALAEKSPLALMLVTPNAAVPVFFRVNVFAVEPPMPTDPKELEAGESVAVWLNADGTAATSPTKSNRADARTCAKTNAFIRRMPPQT
ncbi:MAG TPA: hypothetical protein VMH85_18625 [Terriglobales bacterium]|nr:hypothetical protein [Terriglobales bacterium]